MKHSAIIQWLSEMFIKYLIIGLFKYQLSPSLVLLTEPFCSEIWETFKINRLIYPGDPRVAPERCFLLFIRLPQGVMVEALSRGHALHPLPPHTHTAPHPQTGHWWNAAPGILPQLAGHGAAAGWNMIRPLSKHVFLHGCVQGCTDRGNASHGEKSSHGCCAWFTLNGRSFNWLHPGNLYGFWGHLCASGSKGAIYWFDDQLYCRDHALPLHKGHMLLEDTRWFSQSLGNYATHNPLLPKKC